MSNYPLSRVLKVYKRRYLLRQVGMEIFLEGAVTVFFAFKTLGKRLFFSIPKHKLTFNSRVVLEFIYVSIVSD